MQQLDYCLQQLYGISKLDLQSRFTTKAYRNLRVLIRKNNTLYYNNKYESSAKSDRMAL